MAFHEVSLPARLAFGSTGGVERRTEIVTLASGHERRSTPWAQGRRRYLIGAGLRSLDDMAALTAFFEARMGRLYGFRFRDFADFKSCAPAGSVAATDQVLGPGDGARTVFGLGKTYGDQVRPIRKPVAGSVRVAVNGVALSLGGFAVEPATGAVTLTTAPAAGEAFVAELEGPMAALDPVVGRTYGRECDAVLGDARCGVDVGDFPGVGCDKRWPTCRTVFDNGVNFQGFPDIPGDDFLTAYPAEGGRHDGGSRR